MNTFSINNKKDYGRAKPIATLESKEKTRNKIKQDIISYVNSGGQIQKCPAFAYSNKLKLSAQDRQAMNSLRHG